MATVQSSSASEALHPSYDNIFVNGPAMIDFNMNIDKRTFASLEYFFPEGGPMQEGGNYFIDSPQKLALILTHLTGLRLTPREILLLASQGAIPGTQTRPGGTLINAINAMPSHIRGRVIALTAVGVIGDNPKGETDEISGIFVQGLLNDTGIHAHIHGTKVPNATGSICICLTIPGSSERTMLTYIGAGRDLYTTDEDGNAMPFPVEQVPKGAVFQFELYEYCLPGGRGKPDYADFIASVLDRRENFTVMGLSTPWINHEFRDMIMETINSGKIDAISGNQEELEALCGKKFQHASQVAQEMETIMNQSNVKAMIITLGKDGLLVAMKGRVHHVTRPEDAFPLQVVTTTGAGDSVMGGLLAWLTTGGKAMLERAETPANITELMISLGNYCRSLAERRITTPANQMFLAD